MKFHLPKALSHAPLPHIGDRHKPSRDWLLLLALALIVLITSVGWNAWTFVRITNGEIVGDETPTVTGPNVDSIERVREVFSERALEQQRYTTEYRFVDPNK